MYGTLWGVWGILECMGSLGIAHESPLNSKRNSITLATQPRAIFFFFGSFYS